MYLHVKQSQGLSMITTIYSEDADGNRVQLALEKLILVNDEGLEMEILFHKAKDRDFTMHVSDPSQSLHSLNYCQAHVICLLSKQQHCRGLLLKQHLRSVNRVKLTNRLIVCN